MTFAQLHAGPIWWQLGGPAPTFARCGGGAAYALCAARTARFACGACVCGGLRDDARLAALVIA